MDQSNEFQNSEMLQKVRAGKVDEKNIPSTAKKDILKQFKSMHLKGLATHIQKVVLFIVPCGNVLEIFLFEIEEFC